MMSSSSLTKNNVANAVGGKTARACDNCITKRARWYCTADDAFLCQSCDSSVHSANSLARRHERVRLKTASFKSTTTETIPVPSWHHGFTKKARTTRHHGKHSTTATPKSSSNEVATKNVSVNDKVNVNPFHLVPEVGFDEVNSHSHSHEEENEAQLLYRVPIYDPFIADQLYNSPCSVTSTEVENKRKKVHQNHHEMDMEMETFHGLLPSDIELAEFAADVESLLGSGMENECIGMKELGLMKEEEWVNSEKVKVEEEVVEGYEIEMGKESSFELNFDYETCEEVKEIRDQKENNENMGKRKISLQLNYDEVIIAWDGQKCPWTNGQKPNFEAHEACWPEFMGSCGTEIQYPYGGIGYHHTVMGDGGREARVSRYREKRRTRLFSKKIRYEVRKLNAEKRPRMKGRFVKRTSFAAPPTFPLLK